MRLHRLRIESFGAIGNVDVEFGPGLNVLYGPNDLGKSTVVAGIRLGLFGIDVKLLADMVADNFAERSA